jgi:adenylosuccinate synthase
MPGTIVIGAQWGDEGKGKVVDVLAARSRYVVRYAGGANAGHTIIVGGKKYVLHLIPSGILSPGCTSVIGNGCVVALEALTEEIETLEAEGHTIGSNLQLSEGAHVVTPYHRLADKLSGGAIGTTGRGIGPAYVDKARRAGLRLADLRDGTYAPIIEAQAAYYSKVLPALYEGVVVPTAAEVLASIEALRPRLLPHITDPIPDLNEALRRGENVLFEGAQGVMLDIDHGTYPFVTSSNTTIGGAMTGSGVFVEFAHRVAVIKAYSTRVGNGPFPTELSGELDARLRDKGQEYGATTGRPRRCGWLDLPALRRASISCGFNAIALMKLDVLQGIHPIRAAIAHKDGVPEYRSFDGFHEDISGATSLDDLPPAARTYLRFIEDELEAPIMMVSTGPGREHTIHTGPAW